MKLIVFILALIACTVSGFQPPRSTIPNHDHVAGCSRQHNAHGCSLYMRNNENKIATTDRRSWLNQGVLSTATVMASLLPIPQPAHAGIDPSLLKSLPVQGDESGAAQRLRQVEAMNRPSSDSLDMPFADLGSGVSYREYRQGKGEAGM
jgi:hypothetical protein